MKLILAIFIITLKYINAAPQISFAGLNPIEPTIKGTTSFLKQNSG